MDPPRLHRAFAVQLPIAFRAFRPLLSRKPSQKPNGPRRCRWGAAAGAAVLGMAGAGGLPPLQPPLLSGAAGGGGGRSGQFGNPDRRWTDVLLVVNVAMYGLQLLTNQGLTVWGMKINKLILAGQYWRLLTPCFLHGSLWHLAMNCYSLNNLGPLVEATSGPRRFLVAYLLAGVAGNMASFLGSKAPSLGASGAIFGIGGALAMYFYRNRDIFGQRSNFILKQLQQTLIINLVYGFTNPGVDNWGHLGGLLGGALAAFLLGPHYAVQNLPGRRGVYLVDKPPLPLLTSDAKQIRG